MALALLPYIRLAWKTKHWRPSSLFYSTTTDEEKSFIPPSIESADGRRCGDVGEEEEEEQEQDEAATLQAGANGRRRQLPTRQTNKLQCLPLKSFFSLV